VKRLAKSPELEAHVDKYCKTIIDAGKRETTRLEDALNFIAKASATKLSTKIEETKIEKELKKLVPKRSFKGTLSSDTFRQALGQKEYEWYELIQEKDLDFNKKMLEIVNFMDGKRTAHDIATAISSEYSATHP
jgi:hypothetical protein